jgi:hypothetical protein
MTSLAQLWSVANSAPLDNVFTPIRYKMANNTSIAREAELYLAVVSLNGVRRHMVLPSTLKGVASSP